MIVAALMGVMTAPISRRKGAEETSEQQEKDQDKQKDKEKEEQ